MSELLGYIVELEEYEKLKKINSLLFSDKKIDYEKRRDVANYMYVILQNITSLPLTLEDLK